MRIALFLCDFTCVRARNRIHEAGVMPALRVAYANTAKKQQNARDVTVRCGRPYVDIRFLSAVASATNRAAGAMAEGDGFLPSRISGTQLSVTLRARGEYARGEGIVLSFSRLSTARAV